MVAAAGGLMMHIRRLLRPGAVMRSPSTVILGIVQLLLVFWAGMGALAVGLESRLAGTCAKQTGSQDAPLAPATQITDIHITGEHFVNTEYLTM